mmetsp:Transcript_14607/g.41716  ORF Transcript_14607/g.41716 Transcript_14607/m.41716 type:complete len:80 (-) Transcript_14607:7-246(-)
MKALYGHLEVIEVNGELLNLCLETLLDLLKLLRWQLHEVDATSFLLRRHPPPTLLLSPSFALLLVPPLRFSLSSAAIQF